MFFVSIRYFGSDFIKNDLRNSQEWTTLYKYGVIAMLTEKTINILKEKAESYNVKRLLLFGSCLTKPEEEAGDIDLAVEGIETSKFLTFYSDLLFDNDIGKNIDLIDMSRDVTIMPVILETGVVIYESSSY
jgi:predicted nucleotidyltransferase